MSYLFVDGSNLAARCFFAQMDLMTLDGRRTGLIHGFLKSLASTRHQVGQQLERTCIFWDNGRSARRIALYPEYKQGRKLNEPKTEQEIEITKSYRLQTQIVKSILRSRPIRQIEVPGVEADDMIALFARTVALPVVISSGDKDLHQLSSSRITIFDPNKGLISKDQICEYWGLPEFDPERLVFLRAMQGDASDAIKGIKGIGEKRAAKVLPYLKIDNGGIIQVQNSTNPSTQKLIDKVLENQSIVKRNMELMRLPGDWSDCLYEPSLVEEAMLQFQHVPDSDYPAFGTYLKEYEMVEILDHLERY